VGLVVLLTGAAMVGLIARQAGRLGAAESARHETVAKARAIVEPRLSATIIDGERSALSVFDEAMRRYVLKDDLVRVKLWDSSGRIVYSDEPQLIGARFPLGTEEAKTLRASDGTQSEVSDLERSENRFELPYGRLLEVYVRVRAVTGVPLLFEAYFKYRLATDASQAVLHQLAGSSIGALAAIELALIPVAGWVLKRNRRRHRAWERLREHAALACDLERRRLAGDLHDGVVQDLAGINYALERLRLSGASADQRDEVIASSASRLRGSIGDLRDLLVDIYPPALAEHGLGCALAELADGLQRGGMDVDLETEGAESLPPAASALIFRAAQEAIRNVATHSGAGSVVIKAGRRDGQATLVVEDDGRGFDDAQLQERIRAGHLGLRSTSDLMAAAGGTLRLRAVPGEGTRVMVEVPAE
jgi:signal transduction histidine kinase